MTKNKPEMQLVYTVRNVENQRVQSFVVSEAGKTQSEMENIAMRGIRLLAKGGTPLTLVKMVFVEKPPVKEKKTRRKNTANKPKPRVKKEPLLFISIANAKRYVSATIAKKLTEYLEKAPENQDRIDEVLFILRFTLLLRSSKNLEIRKDLKREDFQDLLMRIFDREVWSPAMIAAFWEIRLLFNKNDRHKLRNKHEQEIARVNKEKGQAYFTNKGQYVEEPRTAFGLPFLQIVKDFVYSAFHREELGGCYELSFE